MEQTIQIKVEVAGGGWVTVDVYGEPDAPALVLVPGVLSDARAWRDVARSLDAWPTVAVVNRRGRRPSGPLTAGYSLATEVDDLAAVLDRFTDVRTLFGWSYGGLVALHLANARAVAHVVAYEPVMRPFGAAALPALRAADEAGDRDRTVEIVTRQVSGMDAAAVESLRADARGWETLRRLGEPVYAETVAIDTAPSPSELATRAGRVDLIVGADNRGRAPYGTSFDDVARTVPRATVHELEAQGHMAHLEAPSALARLVDGLGTASAGRA